MTDPTYVREAIDAKPEWALAFKLSELENDNAPIGWSAYVPEAVRRLKEWKEACEETLGMVGEKYIRCGRLASTLIKHRGRSEGPYFMCFECGEHNARNRNAVVLARKE